MHSVAYMIHSLVQTSYFLTGKGPDAKNLLKVKVENGPGEGLPRCRGEWSRGTC